MKARARKSKIVFIGYRATGKSTLAAELARRWRIEWRDSDVVVEETLGKSIADVFRDEGETFFRDVEADVLARLLRAPEPMIVATGGGAPMRDATRALMKETAVVVWLVASVETIAQRMLGDASSASRRPSLTKVGSAIDEIERVLRAREPIYRDAATIEIATDGKTVDELVEEIADRVPEIFF